jgi:drug/metabolite transporter, DME family
MFASSTSIQYLPGITSAIIAAFIWGAASRSYSSLSQTYAPYLVNSTRTIVACIIFMAAFWLFNDSSGSIFNAPSHTWIWFLIAAFASFGFGDVLFLLSTRKISVSAALTIGAVCPLVSSIASWCMERSMPSILEAVGVATVCAGVVTVIMSDNVTRSNRPDQTDSDTSNYSGYLLAVGTMLCWALLSVAMVKGSEGLPTIQANFLRVFVATFVCIGVGFAMEREVRVPILPAPALKSALWVCLFEMGLGGYTFTYAFQHAPLPVAATLTSTHPLFACAIGLYLGTERFSRKKLLGIVVVLIGIGMVING